ncbi:CD1247 N-terminal domain-containing protein [Kroppenstedtia guangzhouensis]|uniref:CD1247 N-terminal domain-containing protein n=1 Tax=Kroppenstedtia guangzhouensis TaxID=1274356 RepID=UPI00166A6A9A|nr:CD1247 N-terminal domain-containing protein [Kroppenstedtia guangzhouensis]
MEYQSHVPSNRLRRDLAFIRGLMEGQGNAEETPEGKVLGRLVHVLDELAEENEKLTVRLTELEEYVEAVDEDLNELELIIYDGEEFDDEDIGFWDVKCTNCGEPVLVDEEIFESAEEADLLCPQCNTVLRVNDEGNILEESVLIEQ